MTPTKLKRAVGRLASLGSGRDRAQMAGQRGLTGLVVGIMVSAIVVFEVFIPVVTDAASNLSGTEATIAGLLPLFGALLVLIGLASPLIRRV